MKLTTIAIVSVDGVMQGLGGPDEDRSGGFERLAQAGALASIGTVGDSYDCDSVLCRLVA